MCARFRDLGLLLNAIMSTSILLTPVLWDKDMLGSYEKYVYLNPFTAMIEAIRDPLIGVPVNSKIYILLILYAFVGFSLSAIFYKIKHKQFNFWL